MTGRRLDVHLHGSRVATLEAGDSRSGYRLVYDDEWRSYEAAAPVSLSLPLTAATHTGAHVFDFVDNLLPDNPVVREEWARASSLPDADPATLLSVHGADVAGALQFTRAGESPRTHGSLAPETDESIARRIRSIRDGSPDPLANDSGPGRFSLGGAQAKFALARAHDEWWDPSGATPSTHIFKPQVTRLEDGEIVEHLTMAAAQAAGIPSATTEIAQFGEEFALQVERFDRADTPDGVVRLHQEDLLQALGRPRLRKYESQGGPSAEQIIRVLDRNRVDGDRVGSKTRFIQALLFSWIVLNTDGHAKNFSLYLFPGRSPLTPAYDVSSFLPYVGPSDASRDDLLRAMQDTRLSMRISASYRVGDMGAFEWGAIARTAAVSPADLLEWGIVVCEELPGVFADLAADLDERFRTPVVELLLDRIELRARQAKKALARRVEI